MTDLAELQQEIQRAVLGKRSGASALLAKPPRGTAEERLSVYRNAYGLRLTEFLAHDYEKLRTYLGEIRFRELAERYAVAHPSDHPNARWFSRHLPEFLTTSAHYRRHPEIAELAMLERAINDAFDGPEHDIVGMAELAALAPPDFSAVALHIAPTVHRLSVTTNVSSLWSSLMCEERPPVPEDLSEPQQLMVWRQAGGSRFRILGEEEAMAVDSAREGMPFGVICEMISVFDGVGDAALRAAGYLRGWIEAEIISSLRIADGTAK